MAILYTLIIISAMQLSESSLRNKNKTIRGKFRKEDIGQPENFRHVFHVGPDTQEKVDETLKEFFLKVNNLHLLYYL